MSSVSQIVSPRGIEKPIVGRPKARAAWQAFCLWSALYCMSLVTNPALRAAGALFAIGCIVNAARAWFFWSHEERRALVVTEFQPKPDIPIFWF